MGMKILCTVHIAHCSIKQQYIMFAKLIIKFLMHNFFVFHFWLACVCAVLFVRKDQLILEILWIRNSFLVFFISGPFYVDNLTQIRSVRVHWRIWVLQRLVDEVVMILYICIDSNILYRLIRRYWLNISWPPVYRWRVLYRFRLMESSKKRLWTSFEANYSSMAVSQEWPGENGRLSTNRTS